MGDITLQFEWEVPEEGFRWVDEASRGTTGTTFTLGGVLKDIDPRPPWLIGPPVGARARTVSYHPLNECPGLYRTFADLPLEKEAILEFAQRYGRLTKGLVLVEERGEKPLTTYYAEPWYFWLREIQDMRDALLLFDLLQGKSEATPLEEGLQKVIVWQEDGVYFQPWDKELRSLYTDMLGYYESAADRLRKLTLAGKGDLESVKQPERIALDLGRRISKALEQKGRAYLAPKLIACPTFYGEQFQVWKRTRDVVAPARLLLARMVTEKLVGKVDFQLKGDERGFSLAIVPQNLLSALWLALLFEILGKVRLRQCPICGTWFDASAAPQRVFCDSRGSGCRQRASRLRKKLKALLNEGKTLQEAARELEIDFPLADFLLKTAAAN